jgi:hypothetical protein
MQNWYFPGYWSKLWRSFLSSTQQLPLFFFFFHYKRPSLMRTPSLWHLNITSDTLFISLLVVEDVVWWRAPQQMLQTHPNLEAYCGTLWWRWLVFSFFTSNGAPAEWNWQGKTEVLGEKPVPVPLCPPQIPHGLIRSRTRASAVRDRQLTAWTLVEEVIKVSNEDGKRYKLDTVEFKNFRCTSRWWGQQLHSATAAHRRLFFF